MRAKEVGIVSNDFFSHSATEDKGMLFGMADNSEFITFT